MQVEDENSFIDMLAWMMTENTYNPLESTAIDINGPLCVSIFTNGSLTVGLHKVTLPRNGESNDKIAENLVVTNGVLNC